MRRSRRRPGFLMIQMLITITLLGAFAIVADRVFRLSILTTAKVTERHEAAIRLERALTVIRQDVWSATAVSVTGPARLAIDGGKIEWQVDLEGQLVRREKNQADRFGPLPLTFEARPPLVGVSSGGREVAVLRQAINGGGGQ